MRLLKDSPKLRFLVLGQVHFTPNPKCCRHWIFDPFFRFTILLCSFETRTEVPPPCWNEPSHVPDCLLSSFQYFEWRRYEGREEEEEVAKYILNNSRHLEMATFYPKSTDPVENLQMLMELLMSPRASSICQLQFHGNYNPVSEWKKLKG